MSASMPIVSFVESTDDTRFGDRRRLLVGAVAVCALVLMTVTAIWITRDEPIVSTADAAPSGGDRR